MLFDNEVYRKAELLVLGESVELYQEVSPWNRFETITGALSGVEAIEGNGGEVKVWNLEGVKVYEGTPEGVKTLPKGMYILKDGKTSRKVRI